MKGRDDFFDRLARSLAGRRKPAGLFLIHLENFKRLSSGLGPGAAEAILEEVEDRMTAAGRALPAPAEKARRRRLITGQLAGDELAILLLAPADETVLTALAEDLVTRLSAPVTVADHIVGLDVSVGLAAPLAGDDSTALTRRAHIALEDARLGGGSRFSRYTPEMETAAGESLELETRLRRALETDELFLLYQPQVSLQTGRVEGVEALVRWDHPALGTILPGRFISLAEERGLGLAICEKVMQSACRQLQSWHAAGLGGLDLSLNLTSDSLELGEVSTHLAAILAETGVDPAHLELEITEHFAMDDPEAHSAIFAALRDLGVSLALDDFGTGYSSLTYLQRLPVNRLKIDRSFIAGLPDNPQDLALVKGIIGLGHGLGLKVVAEGVETEAQRAALAVLGCDSYQGFLFAPPLTADEVIQIVTEPTHAVAGGRAAS